MRKIIRSSKHNCKEQCPGREKGMTGIAIALILVLVAFFAMIILRLFPIYMEHFSVTSHLKTLSKDAGASKKTNSEII